MPNICRNRLIVTGSAFELDRFLTAARGIATGQAQVFSLDSLFPIPAHLHTGLPIQNSQEDTWYTWCVTHWGTKWDVRVTAAERRSATEFQVRFDSAWSAPTEAFTRRIAPIFPALTFALHTEEEDGSQVSECRWRNGEQEGRRE